VTLETVRVPVPNQLVAGRYQLLEKLGSGGMGLVFLAEQVSVGNKVAIKFLDPEPSPDAPIREARFLQEAKVSLAIVHPGVALLLDSGKDKERGYLYLVFEYVEGLDLRELLTREWRLPFSEAKAITLRIAEALAFAHQKGIVHRDVKPENVRVRRDLAGPHVKVLDFGIARLVGQGGLRLTAEGRLAGTPRYMAPEQVRDKELDARTDVYALGLVFFEMLAGQPAFDGINHAKLMLRQVQEPLPRLAAIAPELDSPAVDAFLQKACAKDPNARFQSMAELVAALQALEPTAWPQSRGRPERPDPSASATEPALAPSPDPAVARHSRPADPPAQPRPQKMRRILWVLIAVLGAAALVLLWRLH
jgi:serine/threonine-protein kinase